PCRPVGRVTRGLLQGLDDHSLDVVVGDRAWRSRTRLLTQPIQPARQETLPPPPPRVTRDTELCTDRHVGAALGARQHDPAPQRQRLRTVASARPTLERL